MKRSILIVGGIAVLVLLAGAAFVAGRLLNREQQGQNAGIAGEPMGGASDGMVVSIQVERAEELPDSPPDVVGQFARREDNSIFVNEAGGGVIVRMRSESSSGDAGEGPVVSGSGPDTTGREIEIVVTNETLVYKDVTAEGNPPASSGTVQQKLEPGSIDEIGTNSLLAAWGEQRGERLIARVLVYSEPVMTTMPGED